MLSELKRLRKRHSLPLVCMRATWDVQAILGTPDTRWVVSGSLTISMGRGRVLAVVGMGARGVIVEEDWGGLEEEEVEDREEVGEVGKWVGDEFEMVEWKGVE